LLRITAAPDSYHIVYRVDDYAGGKRVTTTDDLLVRRPFDSRLETRMGPPPGAAVESVTVSAFGLFSTSGPNSSPLVSATTPGVAADDLRLDASLANLVAYGDLRLRERRRVLGTDCQVYRAGAPIGAGSPPAPTATDYADECVDARGLLLEEVWVSGDKVLSRKLATQVDTAPTFAPNLFQASAAAISLASGGGEVIPLTLTSRPDAAFWQLPAPPAGFTEMGRYLIRTASAPSTADEPTHITDSVADVFVDGGEVVIIDQGNDPSQPPPPDPRAKPIKAGDLPSAQTLTGVYGNVVQAQPDEVSFVVLTGTVPQAELVAIAGQLRPQPKGQLIPLPSPSP
jgi:hypothetical protein